MVDKRPIGYVPGKGNPLDKKAPKNAKFSNVKATVDTGFHVNHIEVLSNQVISKRKNEIFRRIKPATLAHLINKETNLESIYNLSQSVENLHSVREQDDNKSTFSYKNPDKITTPEKKSNLPGLLDIDQQSMYSYYTQNTEAKMSTASFQTAQIQDGTEFIVLDLREPEDYEQYHVKEAINFPAPNIGRDKFTPQIYSFKNKENKLIIIYHLDERNGIPYATALHEKGFENVFLVTGGAEGFAEEFPTLCEGKNIPAPQKISDKTKKILYKRSNYLDPSETGDFRIQSNHIGLNDENQSQATQKTSISKRSMSQSYRKVGNLDVSKVSGISKLSKLTSISKQQQTKK